MTNAIMNDYCVLNKVNPKDVKNSECMVLAKKIVRNWALDPERELICVLNGTESKDALDNISGVVNLSRKCATVTLSAKKLETYSYSATDYSLKLRKRSGGETIARILSSMRLLKSTIDDVSFHARFSEPWHSKTLPCFKILKDSWLAEFSQLDSLNREEIVSYLNSKEGQAQYLKVIEAPVSDLTELEEEQSEVLKEWFKDMVACHSSYEKINKNAYPVIKTPQLDTSFRRPETASLNLVDSKANLYLLALKYVGENSYNAVSKLMVDSKIMKEVAHQLSSHISLKEFDKAVANYDSKIKALQSSSRYFCLPRTMVVATAENIFRSIMRHRIIEGAGFGKDITAEFDINWAHTVSLVKEERMLLRSISDLAAKHLETIAYSGSSEMVMKDKLDPEVVNAMLNLDKTLVNNKSTLASKTCHALITSLCTGNRPLLNADMRDHILSGKLSIPTAQQVGENVYRYYSSTRSDNQDLMSHVSEYNTLSKSWTHHFFIKGHCMKTGPFVIDSPNSSLKHLVGHDLYNIVLKKEDNILVHYSEKVHFKQIIMSNFSTQLLIQVDDIFFPLFTIEPSAFSIKEDLLTEQGLEKAVDKCMEIQSNPIKTMAKLGFKRMENNLNKIEDNYTRMRADMSTPTGAIAIATGLLKANLDLGDKTEMISKPFFYQPKRMTLSPIQNQGLDETKEEESAAVNIMDIGEDPDILAALEAEYIPTQEEKQDMGMIKDDFADLLVYLEDKTKLKTTTVAQADKVIESSYLRLASSAATFRAIRNSIYAPLLRWNQFDGPFYKFFAKTAQLFIPVAYAFHFAEISTGSSDFLAKLYYNATIMTARW
jgi:hypothetical protein